jgi:hypothetical protein
MNLPEGLHLTLTDNGYLGIVDAQGIPWINFTHGGTGDPADWLRNTVKATCSALNVTEAFDDEGFDMTVDDLINNYLGSMAWL